MEPAKEVARKAESVADALVPLVVGVAVLVGGAAAAIAGAHRVAHIIRAPSPAYRCAPGQQGHCFQPTRAVVTHARTARRDWVTISYGNDRTLELRMRDHWKPPIGAVVTLEHWDALPVALYDTQSEKLHRTGRWPDSSWGIKGALLILLAVVLIGYGIFCISFRWLPAHIKEKYG